MSDDPYAAVKDDAPKGNLDAVLCQLATELVEAQAEVERVEAVLVLAKEVVKNLTEVSIPTVAEGLEGKFKLSDGRQLEIREDIRTSIAGAKRVPAIEWLDRHDYGHIVKRVLAFEFKRDDQETFKRFRAAVEALKMGLVMKENYSVHHATLNAWVREQLSEGVDLPTDTFGIFRQRTAKVTE